MVVLKVANSICAVFQISPCNQALARYHLKHKVHCLDHLIASCYPVLEVLTRILVPTIILTCHTFSGHLYGCWFMRMKNLCINPKKGYSDEED